MGQFFKIGLAVGLGAEAAKFISGFLARVMYQVLQDAKDKIQDDLETLETEEAAEE